MSLPTTVTSLRVGKEHADAVRALEQEDSGGKEDRQDSSAAHDYILCASFALRQKKAATALISARQETKGPLTTIIGSRLRRNYGNGVRRPLLSIRAFTRIYPTAVLVWRVLMASPHKALVGTIVSLMLSTVASAAAAKDKIILNRLGPTTSDLFIANADGTGERKLLSTPETDYSASFSRDGKWIVFTSERKGSADIYRAHLDGSGLALF
jgi:WD40-like Beta Propeller Repeat